MPELDLVGLTEIATMLGVSRQRADVIVKSKGFPPVAAAITAGRIWRRADVERWARKAGRLR